MIGELICQYCAHRNGAAESRCLHCGAPLAATVLRDATAAIHDTATGARDAATVARVADDFRRLPFEGAAAAGMYGRDAVAAAHSAAPPPHSGADAAPVNRLEALIARWLEGLGWRPVALILAVLAVLALLLIHGCSKLDMPVVGQVSAAEALPVALHTAASCGPLPGAGAGDRCVIPATSTLLAGGVTGGRELSFTLQVQHPDQLAASIASWRAGGGVLLTDGTVFAAIGPSATVWYADNRTGIRIETAAFAGQSAARTFLNRAGLVQ
ncbi:hypothetical protein [Nocardia sp. alder85J]|uniref:hypothetical protein n=1 Tax=Nocardia sp. alder85J TaxID=2862949 RepID=UPI001CD256FF|nr:hypothetical protein [Nocardia sp. alder85J]MCX4092205.1 hypothetical protein [Nocardia sp. alder85J]